MTRLVHSQGGFIRSLQMSSAKLFAFVEGGLDRSFFDRFLQRSTQVSGIKHQVIAMKELPPGTGGKSALIDSFKAFRKRGYLYMTAFGKAMACVFFADKDADDFCRKQLRSPHFIYSTTYDLEAHLFSCADLHRALADSCGMTLQQTQSLLPDPKAWLSGVVNKWRDWIALCLVSQAKGVSCGCSFGRTSQVNPDPLGPPDDIKVEDFKNRICQNLGISRGKFDQIYRVAIRKVDASILSGTPLRFFKGKWFGHLIQCFLASQPLPPDANYHGVGERLCSTLVAQVPTHSHCACCSPYLLKLNSIMARL